MLSKDQITFSFICLLVQLHGFTFLFLESFQLAFLWKWTFFVSCFTYGMNGCRKRVAAFYCQKNVYRVSPYHTTVNGHVLEWSHDNYTRFLNNPETSSPSHPLLRNVMACKRGSFADWIPSKNDRLPPNLGKKSIVDNFSYDCNWIFQTTTDCVSISWFIF